MKTFMEGKLTAFRGIIMLMLVMCVGLVAKAQGTTVAKQTPCISIGLNGKDGYGDTDKGEKATYLNDTKFIEPAIIVYENNNKQTQVTTASTSRIILRAEPQTVQKAPTKWKKARHGMLTPLQEQE